MTDNIHVAESELHLRGRKIAAALEVDYSGSYSSFVFDIYAYNRHHVHPDTHMGWWRLPIPPGCHRGEFIFDISVNPPRASFTAGGREYVADDFWFNPDYVLEPVETAIFVLRDPAGEIVEMETLLLKVWDREILTGFYEQLHRNGAYSRATGSNPFLSTLHEDKLRILRAIMRRSFPAGGVILDAGCGPSLLTAMFAPLPFDLHCMDLSFSMMRQRAIEFPGAKWLAGNVTDLPFRDAVFDGLFSGEVIEHVHEPEAVLREWRRVLKPGAPLILTTPNIDRLVNRFNKKRQPFAPDHVSELGLRDWLRLLAAAGFTVERRTGVYVEVWLNYFERGPWLDLLQKRHNKEWARPIIRLCDQLGRIFPSVSLDLILLARKT